MDTSNWKRNQGGGGGGDNSMESVDWRTLLPSDTRQKLVNKLMDILKKHAQLSGQHELKDYALKFEEKIYTSATNHDDYIRKISSKLLLLESKYANSMPNSLQSNSACNTVNPSDQGSQGMQQVNNQGQPPPISLPSNHSQASKQTIPQIINNNVSSTGVPPGSSISHSISQSSSLQNIQNISVGNSLGHGIPTNSFVSQRQISGSQNSQHYLYQQQSHQITKQTFQQNSINNKNTTSVQSHIQQQHQNLLQPAHFQPSQLQPTMLQPSSLSTIKQKQPPHFPQSSQPMSQHHQQLILRQQRQQQQQPRVFGQQNNLSNIQSIGQHNNFSAFHQQQLGSQSRQKQQQSLATQSGNSTMLNNQHSSHLMQSTQSQRKQMELQQPVIPQLQTQSAQYQHQLNMKQRVPTSFNQQRAMAEASSTSSDSTAQTGNPNSGDWQEEAYQKLKAMKDKYLPVLTDIYQKLKGRLQQYDSLPQQQNGDQIERLKKTKNLLECCMNFLQIPKNNISPKNKESLGAFETDIVNLISRFNRKPVLTLQQQQQQQRINSLYQSQQTHIPFTQVQPHENQMNNLATLHHNSVANAQQNIMGMLQQSSSNINMLPHQQLKQLQSRQMQQQLMHKQQLLQHHQFHPQTKQNTKVKVNQVSQLNQRNDGNELKTAQQIEMKSDNIKQENTLNSVTKSGTPLQPANSPFIVSSPSTPSVSNTPGDTDKVNSCVLLISNDGNICTPGVSVSPLLAECTNTDVNHANGASIVSGKANDIDQPIERLLKAVKSISPKSLSAAVRDIGSVLCMIDSIAESPPGNGSRTAIGEDLVAMTKATTTRKRKMNHFTNPLFKNVISPASSVMDRPNHLNYLENSELESTASSTIKMPRVEIEHPLLEEIREINQGLIDTVVDISQENADSAAALEDGKGTIVKCSFSGVALCPNLKSQYASRQMSLIQPLRLLVPANYPNCSPIILDKLTVEEVSKEYDLSIKVKWRFSSCVRRLSDPMSLEEMAKTWDLCVRAAILERVQQSGGGGTLTSKYGVWEGCVTAA